MADDVSSAESSNSGGNLAAFLKWAGGIVSAVLIGVLTFWLTHTPPPPPTPTPQPTIPPVALNGVVANADTHVLIGSANVAVTLGPNTVQQETDPLGRYSVVLAPVGAQANMGSVKIAAPGYLEYTNSVALQPGDNYAEIAIDPVPATVMMSTGPPATAQPSTGRGATVVQPDVKVALRPAPVLKAAIVLKKPPPDYVKSAVTAYAGVKKP